MNIENMNEIEKAIRLECLKLAEKNCIDKSSPTDIIASAELFYRWINGNVTIQ